MKEGRKAQTDQWDAAIQFKFVYFEQGVSILQERGVLEDDEEGPLGGRAEARATTTLMSRKNALCIRQRGRERYREGEFHY